jgi:ubiquinone/menaquinone biosynthesis C-methylase UbiE
LIDDSGGLDRLSEKSVCSSYTLAETGRKNVPDPRAEFRLGEAQALPVNDRFRGIVVSALVLNSVPDKPKALS